jgi:hydrogenase maturation protease
MILIIGFGSQVRGDDGIGVELAALLSERLRAAEVITCTQLNPELAQPISEAETVYFIDATAGDIPGTLSIHPIRPESPGSAFSHHLTPELLLGAAHQFYNRAPSAHLITIAGARFAYGFELSPELSVLVPVLANRIQQFIESQPPYHEGNG